MVEHATPSDSLASLLGRIEALCGVEYRGHDPAFLRPRLAHLLEERRIASTAELEARLEGDPALLEDLLAALSAPPAPMFDDPAFWQALKSLAFPLLRTYPHVNVWVPGCGRGEVAYGLAILLREAGLYERSRVYATDSNEAILERARSGVLRPELLAASRQGYEEAGGEAVFEEYFGLVRGAPVLRPLLRERIVFAQHSFTGDASFNEFALVVCRDALSEHLPWVRERGYRLIRESLCQFGILALAGSDRLPMGSRETYEHWKGHPALLRKVRS